MRYEGGCWGREGWWWGGCSPFNVCHSCNAWWDYRTGTAADLVPCSCAPVRPDCRGSLWDWAHIAFSSGVYIHTVYAAPVYATRLYAVQSAVRFIKHSEQLQPHTQTHTNTHTHKHTHKHTHTNTHTNTNTNTHTQTHTHKHTQTHTNTHTYTMVYRERRSALHLLRSCLETLRTPELLGDRMQDQRTIVGTLQSLQPAPPPASPRSPLPLMTVPQRRRELFEDNWIIRLTINWFWSREERRRERECILEPLCYLALLVYTLFKELAARARVWSRTTVLFSPSRSSLYTLFKLFWGHTRTDWQKGWSR